MRHISTKGQSTLEYTALVMCVALALGAMYVYARRAVSGNIRERADGLAGSYEPGEVTADVTTELLTETKTAVSVMRNEDEEDVATTDVEVILEENKRFGTEAVDEIRL